MSNEGKAVAKVSVSSGGQIAAFVPQSLDEAWRLAGALAASGMTPKAYGGDQNKVMVGIMAGAELGLTPFAALQSIAVIGNNPAVWGDGMLALVEASGKLADIEETDDGHTATCRVERIGRKTATVRTFSMDDAKKAGLAGKSGPWTQYPARMRQMRARAFALRDTFSDVLRGIKMVEEVRDYAPMDGGQMQGKSLTAAALIEQATAEVVKEGIDPETGEVLTGRSDEQHGDQHDGIETVEAEEVKDAGKAKMTPAQQVDAYSAAVAQITDLDQLREYQTLPARAKWIEGIKASDPELHQRIIAANGEAMSRLMGRDDDEASEDNGDVDQEGAGEPNLFNGDE